jgi:hypothetical protein
VIVMPLVQERRGRSAGHVRGTAWQTVGGPRDDGGVTGVTGGGDDNSDGGGGNDDGNGNSDGSDWDGACRRVSG